MESQSWFEQLDTTTEKGGAAGANSSVAEDAFADLLEEVYSPSEDGEQDQAKSSSEPSAEEADKALTESWNNLAANRESGAGASELVDKYMRNLDNAINARLSKIEKTDSEILPSAWKALKFTQKQLEEGLRRAAKLSVLEITDLNISPEIQRAINIYKSIRENPLNDENGDEIPYSEAETAHFILELRKEAGQKLNATEEKPLTKQFAVIHC